MSNTRVYIYRIYFSASGKCYIGQTNDPKSRMSQHLRSKKSLVGRALQKYEGWKISVLHTCYSRDEANRIEIEEIRNFDSVHPNGYNLTHGGDSGSPSEETREKLRKASTGQKRPELSQRNRDSLGVKRSQEVVEKNRESHRGLTHSEKTKSKMRVAQQARRLMEYQQKIKSLEQEIQQS